MARERSTLPDIDEPEDRVKYIDTGERVTEPVLEQYDVEQIPEYDVTNEMLQNDSTNPESWLSYNKGLEETGYSPADRVNVNNVDTLTRSYEVTVESAGMETNPVVAPARDGGPPVMYFTEMNHTAHAVNARTGEELWTFQPEVDPAIFNARDPPRDRGVAVWQDKVYITTNTAEVVAVNRQSGEPQWRSSAIVQEQRENMAVDPARRHGISAAPMLYDGKVYVGQSADEGGWAYVVALDAQNGDQVWSKSCVYKPGWVEETWRFGSGGAWMNAAIDPQTDQVFWVTGNPGPMYNGIVRPGPNNDTNAIIACDAQTGDVNWAYQSLPHELWDYDFTHVPSVFDAELPSGETRRAVQVESKDGWVYTVDAQNGQLLQRSQPFEKQDHTKFGRSFLAMPPRGEENRQPAWPPNPGASEWPPSSYSPQTGLRYVGSEQVPSSIAYDPDWFYDETTVNSSEVGGWYGAPDNLRENYTTNAYINAVDPVTGELVWRQGLPDIGDDIADPALLWPGGTAATAGNLVFIGSSGGHLYAHNAETGKRVWQDQTGARITAAPVVWDDPQAGKQFVAVASSGKIVVYEGGGSGGGGGGGGGGNGGGNGGQ